MDIATRFRTSEQAEREGIWVPLENQGAALRIARVNNPAYKKLYQHLTQDYRVLLEQNLLPDEVHDPIIIEVMAATILLDWKGIEFGGEPLEYSKENCVMALTELKEFRTLVYRLASSWEAYRVALLELDVKNS